MSCNLPCHGTFHNKPYQLQHLVPIYQVLCQISTNKRLGSGIRLVTTNQSQAWKLISIIHIYLAKGSSGYIDERKSWSWMTLEIGINFPQIHEVFHGEETSLSPSCVKDWSSVTLRQDESIEKIFYDFKT